MRRLNYTGRIRIAHHHVHTTGTFIDGRPLARVELDLATLNFDPDAEVFVEFYRRTAFVRHSVGRAGDPLPLTYEFDEFGQPEGVLIRVKVVGDGDDAGRLLGVAERVRIAWDDNEGGTAGSLLPFRAENLGSLVWDLDLDDQPVVLMNEDLPDWNDFARSQGFVAIAYPEIVRRVAMWTARSIDDDGPIADWREFFADLTGAPIPFEPGAVASDFDDVLDDGTIARWADECARRFAEVHRVVDLVRAMEESS